jgi:hypothetical protein
LGLTELVVAEGGFQKLPVRVQNLGVGDSVAKLGREGGREGGREEEEREGGRKRGRS